MVQGIAAAVLVLLVAAPAVAQTTRVEAIAQEQEAKAGDLDTEGPGDAELIIRRILKSPLLAGGEGTYPWFGSVFGGTGLAVGAGYLHHLPNAASAQLTAGVSLNKSILMEGQFSAPELWRGLLRLDGLARWTDVKDLSFFGLGSNSTASARERYDYHPTELGGDVTLTPRRRWSLSGGFSWLDIDTERDEPAPTAPAAPGIGEPLRFRVTRGTAAFDSRASPGYSTHGGYYRATLSRHVETTGRPFTFRSEEFEVVQLVPLVREQFVLAFRGLATTTHPDQGHEVPVMLSPYLGSGSTLRGFRNRRFTDRHLLLLTGEYRWRPSRYLDMALFLDAGQVAAEARQLRPGSLVTAWGIGARFHGPTFTAVRLELARGREGFVLVFAGSRAF